MTRAAVVFPGRAGYTAAALGSLPPGDRLVARADELRAERGLPSLRHLDAAEAFDPRTHLRPANASPLTFVLSLLALRALPDDATVVVVTGDSVGWYTALAASEALEFDAAFRIVQEMSLLEEEEITREDPGGQLVYPMVAGDWRPDPRLTDSVAAALAAGDGEVHRSGEVGGYVLLAGTASGLTRLMEALPPAEIGRRRYPLRLAQHGPEHSPLAARIADEASRRLADLEWRPPRVALVDGHGASWSPWSADAEALRRYSLVEQVTSAFRFGTAIRVILREWAPDRLLVSGPGRTAAASCGQVIVAEGYRGIHTRADFERAQARSPLVVSLHG